MREEWLGERDGTVPGDNLIRSQRLHGIDGGCASGWNESRGQAADDQQPADRKNCGWIKLADPKEKPSEDPCGKPGAREPAAEAKHQQSERLFQDKQHHIPSLRAQGHTDANFTGAAAHGIGHEAIESDQGEKQRDACEYSEQRGLKATTRTGFRDEVGHGANIGNSKIIALCINNAIIDTEVLKTYAQTEGERGSS